MIELSASYSGGQLGRAISRDPEEFGYFLRELSELSQNARRDLIDDVATELGPNADVTAFLRELADGIDPAEAQD